MLQGMEYREWINSKLRINQELLYLTRQDVLDLHLTDDEITEMTKEGMIAYSTGNAEMPAKIGIHPLKDTLMHAMPANMKTLSSAGIKWGCCFPENMPRFGYTQTTCTLILNDYQSGTAISFMDADYITRVRTAAVALLSCQKFARQDFKTMGMIGCGVQGKQQVAMVARAYPQIEKIYLYDRFESAQDALIAECQPYTKAEFVKSDWEELARNSDVIFSAAYIPAVPNPQIKDEWLPKKGQTIIASDCHTHYEDVSIKAADKYYVDSIEEHELFVTYGMYPWGLPKITGETGAALAGMVPGRERADEFIFVNNVGMAVEDIVVARKIFDTALERGIGTKMPL
ncbi:MAG TPA: ornithine cyclodeaminase family protein [Candidatus Anaerotignum merdipullorum]|nr:ornithine cyclodeaminase family protein [Candidatus Anaerotignum merdipullorum]